MKKKNSQSPEARERARDLQATFASKAQGEKGTNSKTKEDKRQRARHRENRRQIASRRKKQEQGTGRAGDK
jgi:hypothetical protein